MSLDKYGDVAMIVIALLGLIYTIKAFIATRDKDTKNEIKVDEEARTEMELKIANLEGRMATSYQELATRLTGIENSMTEVKLNNSAFESRILSGVDKLENKIERLQDLMVKAVLSNNQTN